MIDYQIFVDVSDDANWESITVLDFIVQADSAADAYASFEADVNAGKYGDEIQAREIHIWEVTEQDRID